MNGGRGGIKDCEDIENEDGGEGTVQSIMLATTRLNPPRGQFSENHRKCITRWEGRDGVIITSFSSIQW